MIAVCVYNWLIEIPQVREHLIEKLVDLFDDDVELKSGPSMTKEPYVLDSNWVIDKEKTEILNSLFSLKNATIIHDGRTHDEYYILDPNDPHTHIVVNAAGLEASDFEIYDADVPADVPFDDPRDAYEDIKLDIEYRTDEFPEYYDEIVFNPMFYREVDDYDGERSDIVEIFNGYHWVSFTPDCKESRAAFLPRLRDFDPSLDADETPIDNPRYVVRMRKIAESVLPDDAQSTLAFDMVSATKGVVVYSQRGNGPIVKIFEITTAFLVDTKSLDVDEINAFLDLEDRLQ